MIAIHRMLSLADIRTTRSNVTMAIGRVLIANMFDSEVDRAFMLNKNGRLARAILSGTPL